MSQVLADTGYWIALLNHIEGRTNGRGKGVEQLPGTRSSRRSKSAPEERTRRAHQVAASGYASPADVPVGVGQGHRAPRLQE
jgi:hypothetical protein